MSKITVIGLGIVGNSIGMGVRRASTAGQPLEVVGFDPDRSREEAALRKHLSVDSIAPDLERAVRDAQLVVISTPISAAREVLSAINPFLAEGAVVTDTLSIKGPVMTWAGELLHSGVSFVGGHPVSKSVDLETSTDLDAPSADLFAKSPYCLMPLPTASSDALNRVIFLVESLGARPLFIDAYEHDSFYAAVSGLPALAGAGLLHITASSPSWADISALAQGQFGDVTGPLASEPEALLDSLMNNRQATLHWIDQYLLALQDLRDLLARGDTKALQSTLDSAHEARQRWARGEEAPDNAEAQMRADLRQAVSDARPTRNLMGTYLSDRLRRRKDGDG
jgi:prephenate dehydrogenase